MKHPDESYDDLTEFDSDPTILEYVLIALGIALGACIAYPIDIILCIKNRLFSHK